jgi:hypothetical protein
VSGWTLVEPCCGSAALSLHLLGARRPLLPYQGSKWRFRHAIGEVLRAHDVVGPPAEVRLTDVSAWGVAMGAVLGQRAVVIERLRAFAAEDARTVYERLHGGPVPSDATAMSAEFLFLQRLSFSGKAVGIRGGCWASPGFNVSSAYGLAGTERFGAVKPMIPSLVSVLEGYDLHPARVTSARRPAEPPAGPMDGAVVYLDPPYEGATLYPDGGLSRAEVAALAVAWQAAGALVLVSESAPVEELCRLGWRAVRLYEGRDDTSPFRGKQEEWLTVGARPVPGQQALSFG